MKRSVPRWVLAARFRLKLLVGRVAGALAVALLRLIRHGRRVPLANMSAAVMRRVGRLHPKHRVGRANLARAFPEKSPAEIEQILSGVWDNLGRLAVEFAFLDRITIGNAAEDTADMVADPVILDRIDQIIKQGRPVAGFAAHLANWELPAVATERLGLKASFLYRAPNIRAIDEAIHELRKGSMGTLVRSEFSAPIKLANALLRGEHVGMLVDQHEYQGVDVTFFGRTCKANPLIAQLARHTGCEIRGVRVVRLPDGNRFRSEITEPLDLPRDAKGEIDIQGTMQLITSTIETWVREHPEQWLWLHRRWR
jgi:KDO2-lipid IV(A) lauroyltransferase